MVNPKGGGSPPGEYLVWLGNQLAGTTPGPRRSTLSRSVASPRWVLLQLLQHFAHRFVVFQESEHSFGWHTSAACNALGPLAIDQLRMRALLRGHGVDHAELLVATAVALSSSDDFLRATKPVHHSHQEAWLEDSRELLAVVEQRERRDRRHGSRPGAGSRRGGLLDLIVLRYPRRHPIQYGVLTKS